MFRWPLTELGGQPFRRIMDDFEALCPKARVLLEVVLFVDSLLAGLSALATRRRGKLSHEEHHPRFNIAAG